MKQQKLQNYTPKFPKKALKGAVLTAAAAIALGSAGGCAFIGVPPVQEPVELDGAIAIDEPIEEPTEQPLRTDGEVMIDEPGEEPIEAPMTTGIIALPDETQEPEELVLDGDVMIADPEQP